MCTRLLPFCMPYCILLRFCFPHCLLLPFCWAHCVLLTFLRVNHILLPSVCNIVHCYMFVGYTVYRYFSMCHTVYCYLSLRHPIYCYLFWASQRTVIFLLAKLFTVTFCESRFVDQAVCCYIFVGHTVKKVNSHIVYCYLSVGPHCILLPFLSCCVLLAFLPVNFASNIGQV